MGHVTSVAIHPQSTVAVAAVHGDRAASASALLATGTGSSAGSASPGSPEQSGPIGSPRRIDLVLLHDMVAAAVAPVIDRPDASAEIAPPAEAAAPPEQLTYAVVAAHEERIGMLQNRIAAASAAGAAPSMLDDLRERLRRAEAARRVAIARIAGAQPTTITLAAVQATHHFRRRELASAAASHRGGFGRAQVLALTHRWQAGSALAAPQARSTARAMTALMIVPHGGWAAMTQRLTVQSIAVAYGTHRHGRWRHRGFRTTRLKLAAARRSLRLARTMLTTPQPRFDAAKVGLWRWDGGETWHLPQPASTTS